MCIHPLSISFFFFCISAAVAVPFLILLQRCVTFDYYQCNDCALCSANNLMMMLFVGLMLSGGCVQCDQISLRVYVRVRWCRIELSSIDSFAHSSFCVQIWIVKFAFWSFSLFSLCRVFPKMKSFRFLPRTTITIDNIRPPKAPIPHRIELKACAICTTTH